MTTTNDAPSTPGAFLQLIEYRTDHPEQMASIINEWLAAIGPARTTRWYITTADRDRPGTHLQLVEFPSHQAAMINSSHPATSRFAEALNAIATDLIFRNLDVTDAACLWLPDPVDSSTAAAR